MRWLPSILVASVVVHGMSCSDETGSPRDDTSSTDVSTTSGMGGTSGSPSVSSATTSQGSGGMGTSSTVTGTAGSGGGTGGSAGSGAGTAGTGGTGGAGGSGPNVPKADRGATLPYLEYQAEDGDTNGTRIGPSRTLGDLASEASQRRAVRLDAAGQYVRITSKAAANSIVVRYSIPDKGDGPDSWNTLSVFVNGSMRAKLQVTSRYSWTYGELGNKNPNDPAQGNPHHFYDEARALIGDVPAGAVVSVQKEASDTAAWYVVDLVDLELVAPPLPQPANFMSITECGATPDDATDDQPAIQQCIDAARGQRKGLYIPKGTFRSIAKPLSVDNLTIRGAGMWYSNIAGFNARLDCYGNACKYYDFAVTGDTILRDDTSPESAFSGVTGTGTLLENIWAEHSKTGYWVGPNASGLTIRYSRFRNLYADGVNLWKGTSNSVVEQTHFRNTGDDAFASWSPDDGAACTNNVARFNTVQLPWMANCFGLYGGNANHLEDNICEDVVQYPGILLARQFNSLPFQGSTQILRNSLVRAGGPVHNDGQGAIKFHADQAAISGIVVQDLVVQDATFSGVHLQGPNRIDDLRLQNVTVSAPGTSGIRMNADAKGAATANGVVVTRGGMDDQTRGAFVWTREAGNSGW